MFIVVPSSVGAAASSLSYSLLVATRGAHSLVIPGFTSLGCSPARKAQTFFLHVSSDNSIWDLEKCLFCIDWCI